LETYIPILREQLEILAEECDDPLAINEDTVYRTINSVADQLELRARSQLMTPLRYALTGRKVRLTPHSKADKTERTECTDYHGYIRFSKEFGEIRSWSEISQEDAEADVMNTTYIWSTVHYTLSSV
jgi:hypothetical protein